jgi:hypothetical protein
MDYYLYGPPYVMRKRTFKERSSDRRNLQPSKENIQHFKT